MSNAEKDLDTRIEALSTEAASAGDMAQVAICDRALAGDAEAVAECARVIADATAQCPARALIDRSISHDEIVHAAWSQSLAVALSAECDDHTDANDCHEYWGERDGAAWRVHLDT